MKLLKYTRLIEKHQEESTLIDVRTTDALKNPKKYFAKLEKINNELIVNIFNGKEITFNGEKNFYDTHPMYFEDFKRIQKKIQPKKIAIIRPNNKFTFIADTLDTIDINFFNSISDMSRQMKRDPFKHVIWQCIYSNAYPVYKNLELNMTTMSPTSEISVFGRLPKIGVDLSKLNLYDVYFNRDKEFIQSFTWEKLLDLADSSSKRNAL